MFPCAPAIESRFAVPLALVLLSVANASAWAQGGSLGALDPAEAALWRAADAAPRPMRACKAIAALANRGARALRTADLLGRNVPIDLRNDGHPRTVHREAPGSAAWPILVDEAHQLLDVPYRADYSEAVRWASEISVLRIGTRTWTVDWDSGHVDGTAALEGATDGTAVCRFRTTWRAPTLKLLPEGERARMRTYRALLLGQASVPTPANIDLGAVQEASDLSGLPHPVHVEAPSWRADLMNDGQQLTLVRVSVMSGGGRGCAYDPLGLMRNGRIVGAGLAQPVHPGHPTLAPTSPALQWLLGPVVCSGVAETPVLGGDKRIYILAYNIAAMPNRTAETGGVERVRLLAGVRKGTMRALARLSWKARNELLPPNPP